MRSLTGPIVKSLVFVAVTGFATAMLALTIINGTAGGGRHYRAVFTDVTSLNAGDDVRMAGVRVGQVDSVAVYHHNEAIVGFNVESDVRLAPTATATIRYRNLIGQRYVELDEGDGSLDRPLPGGATIDVEHTTPALDLTVLFNGFQPLFQALSPDDINQLSAEIIAVFQGEGPTVGNLVSETASLTNTLADKDAVIGRVVTNLSDVLKTVNGRGGELKTLVSTLQTLVSGLAADRQPLGDALTGIAGLTTDVGSLLAQIQAPVTRSIVALGQVSANLAGSSGALNSFLQTLPGKLNTIGRTVSYGSWINFYVCTITNVPGLGPDYYGGVGIDNPAARCHA